MRRTGARIGVAALAAVPVLVLVVFFLWPVAGMVARGFWPAGHFAPGDVLAVLGRSRVHRVLWFTVWSAAVATLLSVLLGLPVAFVLHRLDFPGRQLLAGLVTMPFVLPTVVVGVAFRQLLVPGGLLGVLHLDGTAAAIVAALVFFNISVVVRTVGAYWSGIDRRQEQAAAALGASPRQVFLSVTLPAIRPGIVSSASVVFLFCATSFGVVLTMGGLHYANVETEIYLLTAQDLDLTGAAALSILQVLVITALLIVSARARGAQAGVERTVQTRRSPRVTDLPMLLWTAAILAFVLAPIGSLVAASLRDGSGWTLAWYRALGGYGEHSALLVPALVGLWNSLVISGYATVFSLVLGTIVSVLVSRRPRGRRTRRLVGAFDGLFMLPLGVSAVTLGFGFLITLNRPPLDLRTSQILIPIAQAMVALPLVVRTVAPVLASVNPRQRQAAASLGAGPLRVLVTVDLPHAWRALLAATGFAFAVSLGEFGATSFLARGDSPTLPVVIYSLISHPGAENFGMAMAASVLLAAVTATVILLVERLRVGSMGAF